MIYDARSRDFVVLLAMANDDELREFENTWAGLKTTHPLRIVRSPNACLDYLKHDGEYADIRSSPTPGLLLISHNLPGGGGVKLLEEVKSLPGLRRLPVIMIGNGLDGALVEEAYDHGAAAYFTQPGDDDNYRQNLHRLLLFWEEVCLPDLSQDPIADNGQ